MGLLAVLRLCGEAQPPMSVSPYRKVILNIWGAVYTLADVYAVARLGVLRRHGRA